MDKTNDNKNDRVQPHPLTAPHKTNPGNKPTIDSISPDADAEQGDVSGYLSSNDLQPPK